MLPALMNARRPNAGISRIDQPEKRTHGFFVRLQRKGKIFNAFFADKSHGGKRRALMAARAYYQVLLRKHRPLTRRARAKIRRRRSSSGIIGVQRVLIGGAGGKRPYWQAIWSPRPYVIKRRLFSVRKYGAGKAKAMAIKARNRGVRSMTA